ncbi:hypothetical protein DEAC_c23720 [Desulfosporosinus acididurans]|uniref:Uncharacterized protein n=1 Tax=Desulfosporosinus acididurans TaxID=476652 RepID=A0A0J1FR21_9FIRM|nr:hypothetical protein [Desulfosporosinus acididurans]KLU65742.1 hypothetical protein DEAC_c23720 [Desulfosporosinus acididurans]
MVTAHEIKRTLTEVVIDPSHAERTESAEFRRSKARLKEDGHFKCFICGTSEDIQVHHLAEYCFATLVDFDKLKQFCEEFDPYGYGKLLKNKPMSDIGDVRNCLAICRQHHIEKGTGVHETTFPIWLIQKLAKTNEDPVPQDGKKPEVVLKELEERS